MHTTSQTPRQTHWNRVLLNAFWIILIVDLSIHMFVSQCLWGQHSDTLTRGEFITQSLIPDSVILTLIFILEFIYRWKPEWSELAITVASHLFALLIIINLNDELYVKSLIMLLPLLVSMIYMKSSYMIASSAVCLLYTIILFIKASNHGYVPIAQTIIIVLIFASTALAGFAVIGRGRDLMRSLENSVKSEQELRIQNIIMDRLSKIDPLTDLYNHKTFHEYLGWLIDHQQSNPFPMQLAVMDIDNFKKVNDSYGHSVGDIVLQKVAAILLEHVGPDDFAARFGGEEFVVILTSKTLDHSHEIMKHIITSISDTPFAEMNDKNVTVSIGMHDFIGTDSKNSTFQKADDALYEAKNTGKNKIVIS
ncbi:diguanylate cyclase (GGDEF)-like protein [Paenibacillus sp. PastF-3]|uniref:GGDEF domain-containing protein n=1 Tax=Paenibacillus sp. PastF-3 TaxID=2940626 RepID=UPI0024731BCD|nr:GGDEF domain-containing protein [Paenibacillus sp. PastF-3]MDH6370813.1 diguanylate cyclase (GGDEF)-like protein [Paenibacillus sp. PastF-3]